MRITVNNIEMVKRAMSSKHNPETRYAVLLREGREHELRHYSLTNLPVTVRKFIANHMYEIWYEDTDLETFVWKADW